MLGWCTACLVGALFAWLVQLRQLHPLTACFVGALLAWLVQFLLGWCSSCLVGAVETTAPP